ncbi:hypothetical protein ACFX12_043759 [Malus domestica]
MFSSEGGIRVPRSSICQKSCNPVAFGSSECVVSLCLGASAVAALLCVCLDNPFPFGEKVCFFSKPLFLRHHLFMECALQLLKIVSELCISLPFAMFLTI